MSWLIFYGLTRGLRQAAVMNAVTTVAKLLPILAFIVLVAFLGFSWGRFTMDFWGSHIPFTDQLKGIMLYTVWVFIGIEGASVYSKQARVRSDVGKATIIGFLSVLGLLVAVSTLSYGVLSQEELAALPDNSMGAVLEQVVGPWGGALISIGLCLSVLGAYVSWQMLCAEPIVLMALDGLLPRSMGSHNSNGSPVRAQLLSTLAIQFFVVVFFLSSASYNAMVQLATIMYLLPYIFSSIYLVLLTIRGKGLTHPHAGTRFDDSGPEVPRRDNRRHLIVGLIGSVYSLWLIYAADPVYVLLGALAVVPGLVPYIWTRRKHGDTLFNAFEKVVVAVVLVAAVIAVVGLVNGSLVLE